VKRTLLPLACLFALLPFVGQAHVSATVPAVAPLTRTVYVTALDAKGALITDLTAADFAVKEGGKDREIVKAEMANAPLQIAIIVDDNGTGLFRYGLAQFLQKLLGHGEFAISTVVGQTMKIQDYTTSTEALSVALQKLSPRPSTPDGGQLIEGISESAKELLKRKAVRPVIVALTVGGEEHSPQSAHDVLNTLKDSGASLHVISVAGGTLRSTVQPTNPGDALDGALNLGEVLGDGPKQSGGRRDEIVATAGLVQGLQRLADELLQQYAVSYVLPDGVKPNERVSISVKRKGVVLRAPSRIPDKG
jgi:VWFA-related protein